MTRSLDGARLFAPGRCAELAKLAAAASANDAKTTGEQLGVVLSKCADCHTQFRR